MQKIQTINTEVSNIVILVQSASLEYLIRNELKTRFKVHRDFIVDVETSKQLHNAKLDSYVAPLLCDKWLIHVKADKLKKKELLDALKNNTHYGVTVYWVEKWATFNQLLNSEEARKQGMHCQFYRFTRFSEYEIKYLLDTQVPPKRQLSTELRDYVAKNYRYDIQSVMDLIALLKSGNEIDTKKELVEAIGVGGNSVSNLLIQILKTVPKTESGRKRAITKILKLLQDLTYSYNYATIRRFLLSNLDGCIEMKTLQIMGVYNRPWKEIPESFNVKRLSMLRRFESIILEEISLPRLLNLKTCLLTYNNFNAEVALVQAIMEYFNTFELEPEKPKKTKKRKKSTA